MEENQSTPNWLVNGKVDEVQFVRQFRLENPMIWTEGAFFGVDGRITNENAIRRSVYLALAEYLSTNVARKVDSVMNALRMECDEDQLLDSATRIQVSNGVYDLFRGFIPHKEICRYRLPVAYNEDAPIPTLWLKFLDDLLEPEDILTLQEFMGYCLIPTTIAQKMLIITGRGGEGKSRIGVVMKAILGDNMNVGSISKVESSPFARADLEHVLLMVDDDLKMEALSSTNYLKSLVTAEVPMDLERKGIQSYQGRIHARFMAFGNGTLQALHDRSFGFFRRQIILTAKPRPSDREDDPFLGSRLREETEGIFMWCLEGLFRLMGCDFKFTLSSQAQTNMDEAISDGNNITEFMKSRGYFLFDQSAAATSRSLYRVYRDWCEDNTLTPLAIRTFCGYLKQEGYAYNICYDANVPIGSGKYARGFRGIRLLPRM